MKNQNLLSWNICELLKGFWDISTGATESSQLISHKAIVKGSQPRVVSGMNHGQDPFPWGMSSWRPACCCLLSRHLITSGKTSATAACLAKPESVFLRWNDNIFANSSGKRHVLEAVMFHSRHQSYSSGGDYRPRVREAGRRKQLSGRNPLWGSRLAHVFMSGLSLSYYKTPKFSGLTV